MGATSLSLEAGFTHAGVCFLADQVLVVGTGGGGFSDSSSLFGFFIHDGVCLLTSQVFDLGMEASVFVSPSLVSPAGGFTHDGGWAGEEE